MSDNKHRMYADFSEDAYNALQNDDAVFNNGFRDKKGYFHPDQPEFHEIEEDENGNGTLGLVIVVAGVAIVVGAVAGAVGYAIGKKDDIRSWFGDKAMPKIKRTWDRIFRKEQSEEPETTEISVKEFSGEVDTVLNEFFDNQSDEEAQKRLLEIMELAALLAKKIREFSGTVINEDDPEYIEMKRTVERLATQRTTDCINDILEHNPAFLSEAFGELFGVSEKEYVPIQNETVNKLLSLEYDGTPTEQYQPDVWKKWEQIMGFFFSSSNDNEDIDFERLRSDLVDEYGAQMASFSGGLGFCDMCDAEDASNDELIAMAKREGLDLRKYRK